jgi:hypothetical protein
MNAARSNRTLNSNSYIRVDNVIIQLTYYNKRLKIFPVRNAMRWRGTVRTLRIRTNSLRTARNVCAQTDVKKDDFIVSSYKSRIKRRVIIVWRKENQIITIFAKYARVVYIISYYIYVWCRKKKKKKTKKRTAVRKVIYFQLPVT